MQSKNPGFNEALSFTKKERNAIYILLMVMAVFIVVPYFFKPDFTPPEVDSTVLSNLENASMTRDTGGGEDPDPIVSQKPAAATIQPFLFDPNTLDEAGWRKIGLREKTIQTILHYRNKGGYFRNPEDLRKIYGLKKEEADQLIPFVRIKQANNALPKKKTDFALKETKVVPEKRLEKTSSESVRKVNINSATEEDWKALPGIGEVLSKRIVKFRNSIGGFKSVEQVGKTYGLSDSVFQIIRPMLFLEE